MAVPKLRVFSASWPGKVEPWRARFIRDLHADLAHEFETQVIAPAVHPDDPTEEQDGNLRVRRFRYRSGGKSPRQGGVGLVQSCSWMLAGRKELKKWQSEQFDGVTLVHWGLPGAFLAAPFCNPEKSPMVVWCHGSDVHRHGRGILGSFLLRRGLKSAVKVMAASAEMASELKSLHGVSDVEVLPVGIDSVFQAPAKIGRKEARLQALWVGERIESKGYGRALRGVQQAVARGVSVSLEVIGEGPLTGFRDYIPTLRGSVDSAGVREAMDRADLLLLPSHGEGTPLVIQEARSRNLPVAATPVGGIPDLFEAENGWFPLNAKSETDLESEICDLLALLENQPEILQKCRQDLENSSIPIQYRCNNTDRLTEIFREVSS
ncbi:MAG: hypothetical protein CBC13_01865 [Planctomycetia bacterium TMED53]|nr:MAG: hypothetical protein CBC13_01865 [Planctomycetia bacterium TMED53]